MTTPTDKIQKGIVTTLQASDALLILFGWDGITSGDRAKYAAQVRWHFDPTQQEDLYPYVVIYRANFIPSAKFGDERHGEVSYMLECFHNQQTSVPASQVLQLAAELLNGEAGKRALSSEDVTVYWAFYDGPGPEMMDPNFHLWFQRSTLKLTVEYFNS